MAAEWEVPAGNDALEWVLALERFLFFFDSQKDCDSEKLATLLNGILEMVGTVLENEQLSMRWMHGLKRLSLESLKFACFRGGDVSTLQSLVRLLTRQADMERSIISYLVYQNEYQYLRKALLMGDTLDPGFLDFALRPFDLFQPTSSVCSKALSNVILELMTVPNLHKCVAGGKMIPIYESMITELGKSNSLVDTMRPFSTVRNNVEYPGYISLLTNLLSIGMDLWASLSLQIRSLYAKSIAQLVSELPDEVFGRDPDRISADDESDDEDESASPRARIEALKDSDTLTSLLMLYERRHVTMIIELCTKNSDQNAVSLLIALGAKNGLAKSKMLSDVVSSGKGNLDAFFRHLRGTQLYYRCSVNTVPWSVCSDFSLAADWNVLILLVDVLCKMLVTYGDDEFYNDNEFGLSALVEFSGMLRNIAVMFCLNIQHLPDDFRISGSELKIRKLKSSVFRILKLLHSRDSARPFCPAGHWSLPGMMDANSIYRAITEEVQAEKSGEESHNPHLAILQNIPFVIPFEERVKIFRSYINQSNDEDRDVFFGRRVIRVRRKYIFEDGFVQLMNFPMKRRIGIQFVDDFGMEEAGIDGGGVFKEFFTGLCLQAFDQNRVLFVSTRDNLIYKNTSNYSIQPEQLQHFEFLGKILGKALQEGILIDASFASFFLAKWLGKLNFLEDLPSLDQELYKNLMFLKKYTGNAEDLSLNFTIVNEEMGVRDVVELVPNGKNVAVTNENKIRYIFLVANYRLNTQIRRQCNSFLQGLSEVILPKWLRIFNQQELHVLVSGAQAPIDIDDLRANTVYSGAFDANHPTIGMLWRVLRAFNDEDRRQFVKFVTSCPRPPLLGFKELEPKICVRDSGQDEDRLPTAATCMNLLKLPQYKDEVTLRRKLMYALHSGAGFDLS